MRSSFLVPSAHFISCIQERFSVLSLTFFFVSAESIQEKEYKRKYEGVDINSLPDTISDSFNGKNLFVTGGSGFMGKVFLEKLLRTSPNVTKIYVLIRGKKGKDAKDRVHDVFSSAVSTTFHPQHILLVEGKKALKKVRYEFLHFTLSTNRSMILTLSNDRLNFFLLVFHLADFLACLIIFTILVRVIFFSSSS